MFLFLVVLDSFFLVVISTSSWRTFLLVVSSVLLVLVSFLLLVVLSISDSSLRSEVSIGTGFKVTGAGEGKRSDKLQET